MFPRTKGGQADKAFASVFFLQAYQQTGWSVCAGVITLCTESFSTLAGDICFTLVLSIELTCWQCLVEWGGFCKCHAQDGLNLSIADRLNMEYSASGSGSCQNPENSQRLSNISIYFESSDQCHLCVCTWGYCCIELLNLYMTNLE